MSAAWNNVRAELQAATKHDFESMVFAWLKLAYPQLVHPASLKELDRKGVDLGYIVPGERFPLVVQCKGFEVTVDELGDKQVKLVTKSVSSFVKSGLRCERYILLYNRSGRNREFAQKALTELSTLESGKYASSVSLWSLDDLIKELDRVVVGKVP